MIEIRGVKKFYGERENKFFALKGIDLTLKEGLLYVILGASGSGKSTLLHVISGLERPDEGNIRYGETNLTLLNEKELTRFRRENVGFVFQKYYLLPHMNVEQNVRMGAELCGNKGYLTAIRAVGLEEKRGKYPCELSGGEQQRVSIARALAKEPKALFLDEPTGALDENTGRQTLDYINRLQAEKHFTAVMVTHNQNIADTADVVIRMNSGTILDIQKNRVKKSAYEIGW